MPIEDLKKTEIAYSKGDTKALKVLWNHYEENKQEKQFTRFAKKLCQTRHTEKVQDLVQQLAVKLRLEYSSYNPDRCWGRWVNWAKQIQKNIHLQNLRKRLQDNTVQNQAVLFEISKLSLPELQIRLQRKAVKGSFNSSHIDPVIKSLEPLVGRTFVGVKAGRQLSTDLRTRILDTAIVDENQFRLVKELLKNICAVFEQSLPTNDKGAILPIEDPEANPTLITRNQEVTETVKRRIVSWMELEFVRDPRSAACFFLKHFHEGCNGPSFVDLTRKLEEIFPAIDELLSELPNRSNDLKSISWREISVCVFNNDEAYTAKNYYTRRTKPSFDSWQQVFTTAKTDLDPKGDSDD